MSSIFHGEIAFRTHALILNTFKFEARETQRETGMKLDIGFHFDRERCAENRTTNNVENICSVDESSMMKNARRYKRKRNTTAARGYKEDFAQKSLCLGRGSTTEVKLPHDPPSKRSTVATPPQAFL